MKPHVKTAEDAMWLIRRYRSEVNIFTGYRMLDDGIYVIVSLKDQLGSDGRQYKNGEFLKVDWI